MNPNSKPENLKLLHSITHNSELHAYRIILLYSILVPTVNYTIFLNA